MKVRWKVLEYPVIGSTNDEARAWVEKGHGPWLALRADHQTKGRGRHARKWVDQPGKALLMTVVLPWQLPFRVIALMCLAVRHAVRNLGGSGPRFKWPNDLVYPEGKAGGILCETAMGKSGKFVLAGLGLNVAYAREELSIEGAKPTSLWVSERRWFGVRDLFHEVLEGITSLWNEDMEELYRGYMDNLAYLGQEVELGPPYKLEGAEEVPASLIRGVVWGVDREGRLLLKSGAGILRVVSGDLLPLPGSEDRR